MWGRLLYSHDLDAFKKYMKMVEALEPNFRPTNRLYISILSKYTSYENAGEFCQIDAKTEVTGAPGLSKLKLVQPKPIFDWD